MEHTKKLLAGVKRYAKEFSRLVFPRKISVQKMQSEVKEHFAIIAWSLRKVFVPAALIYFIFGALLSINVMGSLFLGLIIFLYSNFLPDVDSVFKKIHASDGEDKDYTEITGKGKLMMRPSEAKWYEKYALLFFAPVFVYYRVLQKAKDIYTVHEKPFHNMKTFCAYLSFLLLIGFVLYTNFLENLSLPVFGGFGYYTHLFVDGALRG